jgi:group I intron endonuclease
MKICGIYSIINTNNFKYYIGYSNKINKRFNEHKYALRHNIHANDHLQKSWNKYGEDAFIFTILEECEIENLAIREHYWATLLKTHDSEHGYNILSTDNKIKIHRKRPLSKEICDKISIRRKGKKHTEETKLKISEFRLNFYKTNPHPCSGRITNQDTKTKISNSLKGKKHTQESKDKMSKFQKGKILSQETKEKMKKWRTGRRLSEEVKKNMSDAQKLSCFINPKQTKHVNQYDLEGNFIREWGSCKEIAEHLNVSITAIRNVCNFRMPTCKNYIFKYLEK